LFGFGIREEEEEEAYVNGAKMCIVAEIKEV
jgi:hypothetical protein